MTEPTVRLNIPADLLYPNQLPVNEATIPRYEARSIVDFVPGGNHDIQSVLRVLLQSHSEAANAIFNPVRTRFRFYSIHMVCHFVRNQEDIRFSLPYIYYYKYTNRDNRSNDKNGRPKTLEDMVTNWMDYINERQQYNSIPMYFIGIPHLMATAYITLRQKPRNLPDTNIPGFVRRMQAAPITQGVLTRSRTRRPDEARYNLRLRGGGDDSFLIGALPTIYVRNPDLLKYFLSSNRTLLFVPPTEEKLCFPMAFLRAQARIIRKDLTYETSAKRTYTEFMKQNLGIIYDGLDYPYTVNMAQPDWKRLPFYSKRTLQLFHPCVCKDEGEDVVDEQFVTQWKEMAWNLHETIEQDLQTEVHYRQLFTVAQVYADYFHVHIHIMEIKSGEPFPYMTFIPEWPINDAEVHVYMVMHEQEGLRHIYPVLKIRSFFCHTKSDSFIDSLCDHCGDTRVKPSDTWTHHLKQCRLTNKECASKYYLNMSEQLMPSSKPHQRIASNYFCETCGRKKNFYNVKECYTAVHEVRRSFGVQCNICYAHMTLDEQPEHLCYIQRPKDREPIPNNSMWVYDVESMQMKLDRPEGQQVFEHQCILVCIQNMYDKTQRLEFLSFQAFAEYIYYNDTFNNAILIAHNGGGYDHLFFLQVCERKRWTYTSVPRPSSNHKLLQLQVTKVNGTTITFLDSLMFCPTSLKNLAQSFGLPVQKGDFPHKFSMQEHLDYYGCFPPLYDDHDWFGLEDKKSEEDVNDLKQWHALQTTRFCSCCTTEQWRKLQGICTCGKLLWNFRSQLSYYCWLDVEVLAESMIRFRETYQAFESEEHHNWRARPADPFCFLTLSQLSQYIFLQGFVTLPKFANIVFSHWPLFHDASIPWLCGIEKSEDIKIIHRGNRHIEYFEPWRKAYVTGLCKSNKTIYLYYHEGWTPAQREEYQEHIQYWTDHHYIVRTKEHDEDCARQKYIDYRQGFYGGRTEVFCASARSKDPEPESDFAGEELIYQDVCSLYPHVCAKTEMPLDHPQVFVNNSVCRNIDFERVYPYHPNKYWGYVYCSVVCPKEDLIGLLPSRDPLTHRLLFDLRDKEGIWHTSELYLAMENGYRLVDIYMVFHWDTHQRSDTFMRGYMGYFFVVKQQAEGWKKLGASSDTPSMEEQSALVEELYQLNGQLARIDPAKVQKNPVKRAIAKGQLNSLWGKFAQLMKNIVRFNIEGLNQYQMLLNDEKVKHERLFLRNIDGDLFSVQYEQDPSQTFPMRTNNYCLAGTVTAHARCILHREMLRIGQDRIVYADTDSIIYMHDLTVPYVDKKGLGFFVNEYPEHKIKRFLALGPKSYLLDIERKDKIIKAKGVQMTLYNQDAITYDRVEEMIIQSVRGENVEPIQAHYMTIKPNSTLRDVDYAMLLTCTGEKMVRPLYLKRALEHNPEVTDLSTMNPVRLYPFGYRNQYNNVPVERYIEEDDDSFF